jgi:Pyridoxamine 5''-phosphate oxidase.
MEINFQTALREKYDRLSDVKEMVLSTCADNQVTSRLVSVACFENIVYFLSWKHHVKCVQIAQNPMVSFCFDNLQMNGIAVIHGDPRAESNAIIAEKYKSKQPMLFRRFAPLEGMIIVEAKISYIKAWIKEDMKFFIEHIDVPKCKAYKLKPEDDERLSQRFQ